MPISFLGALWVVSLSDIRVAFMPMVGIVVLLNGGGLGLLATKMLNMKKQQFGGMYCCGSFTNIGAIEGWICVMLSDCSGNTEQRQSAGSLMRVGGQEKRDPSPPPFIAPKLLRQINGLSPLSGDPTGGDNSSIVWQ